VSTADNYARDTISNVVFVAAEVTEVEVSVLVVGLEEAGRLVITDVGFRA